MGQSVPQLQPAIGDAAWTAAAMHASNRWTYEVTPQDIEAMDRALELARRKLLAIPFDKDQFPLGDFGETLVKLRHEMENGSGVVLMRGIPVDKCGLDGSRLVYWGIGAHLGTALAQTPRAELLVDVRNSGGDQHKDRPHAAITPIAGCRFTTIRAMLSACYAEGRKERRPELHRERGGGS